MTEPDPARAAETARPARPARPRSAAQQAASRANGARSRGPSSPAGKARSARNALRHGLCSPLLGTIAGEDENEFLDLRLAIAADIDPQGAVAVEACERLVRAVWGLRRADAQLGRLLEELEQRHGSLADALAAGARQLELIRRYRSAYALEIGRCRRTIEEAHDQKRAREAERAEALHGRLDAIARARFAAMWNHDPKREGAPAHEAPAPPEPAPRTIPVTDLVDAATRRAERERMTRALMLGIARLGGTVPQGTGLHEPERGRYDPGTTPPARPPPD